LKDNPPVMSSDLRTFLARDLRIHPRVAYQGIVPDEEPGPQIAADLPQLTPFRNDYYGAICVVDWDHRLPSLMLPLRIYAYYNQMSFEAGEEAYDDRLEEIGRRDKYPEFDVPDFDNLAADEAYEIELDTAARIGRCRLTSAWRRQIDPTDAEAAVEIAAKSSEYQRLEANTTDRPERLGNLEAVSWSEPCAHAPASAVTAIRINARFTVRRRRSLGRSADTDRVLTHDGSDRSRAA